MALGHSPVLFVRALPTSFERQRYRALETSGEMKHLSKYYGGAWKNITFEAVAKRRQAGFLSRVLRRCRLSPSEFSLGRD